MKKTQTISRQKKETSRFAATEEHDILTKGVPVSPGVALGVAYVYDSHIVSASSYCIPKKLVAGEVDRFKNAAEKTRRQINYLQKRARNFPDAAGEELGYLLDAYDQMLRGSRLMRGIEGRIENDQVNAEAAVQLEIEEMLEAFASMDDPYLASRAEDVRGVGQRLVRNLSSKAARPFSSLPKHAIILADELTPADTALLDPSRVWGFATVQGGAQSHTGILARSFGLPAVIGAKGLLRGVRSGDPVIVDGNEGVLIVRPSDEILQRYRKARASYLRRVRSLKSLRKVPAVTVDGVEVRLKANIELPTETGTVIEYGAEGIGLLRSEFMFMNRTELPSEEEQFRALKKLVRRMKNNSVTVRTLDIGGDKLAEGALDVGTSPNPALGLRGIRFWLQHENLWKDQLSAILRASAFGNVRILLPMISTAEELKKVRELRDDLAVKLRKDYDIPDTLPPIGVMIEVPSAALTADNMAWHADFFSIGTNDLTQYTLAIDRTDENVTELYNTLHPSVLRLIQMSTEAAFKARIPVGICGEMAADPRLVGLLLGMGVRELSMPATNIPWIKQQIRRLNMKECVLFARKIMSQYDARKVYDLIDEFNRPFEK